MCMDVTLLSMLCISLYRKKSISEVIESCIKSFQTSRNTMAKTVRDEIDCMKK